MRSSGGFSVKKRSSGGVSVKKRRLEHDVVTTSTLASRTSNGHRQSSISSHGNLRSSIGPSPFTPSFFLFQVMRGRKQTKCLDSRLAGHVGFPAGHVGRPAKNTVQSKLKPARPVFLRVMISLPQTRPAQTPNGPGPRSSTHFVIPNHMSICKHKINQTSLY